MKRAAAALLAWLLLAVGVSAQVRVRGDATYQPYKKIVLVAESKGEGVSFLWDVDGECDLEERGATLYVWAAPGRYKVTLTAVDFGAKKIERARFTFTVEGAPAPVPPGPKPPGPTPPGPTPPAPVAGLKVLIVEESADRPKLPSAQQALILGKPFRDLLDAKCTADPDTNSKKAWRILDKDQDAGALAKFYQDALSSAKGKAMPRIVIGSDSGVVADVPLPATYAEAAALVTAYGHKLRKAG